MRSKNLIVATMLCTLGIAGGCAPPKVLLEPLTAPTMLQPASPALPRPTYARPTGDETASIALGQRSVEQPEPALPPQPRPPVASIGLEDWLGEWLATNPRIPNEGDYRTSGPQVLGDHGVVVRRFGDVYHYPDGSWTRRNGNVYQHSDGSSAVRNGDVVFHSDGTWTRRSGDVLLRSNGTSCTLSAGVAFCRGGK
ncbi:hypothetical protein [Azospirillum argentinense]|uniref:hypothetical protein n=1 Tax=Azospirillum argentinense TaxID=2970906 RepID=UPI0032DF22F4